jgi:cilia- and flagella-associated protein 57
MCITKEKTRRFLALAEYNEPERSLTLAIIDLKNLSENKRLRELRLPDSNIKFNTIAFSKDSKLIGCVGAGLGVVWDWYKDKIIGKEYLNADITRISINPKDSHLVSTSGPNHWKTWRIEEKIFKEQPMFSKLTQTQNFTDHDWIDDDTAVAVTDMSEVFVCRSNQIIQYIEFGFGNLSDSNLANASITCIQGFSRGFILASDEGHLAIWEHTENNEYEENVSEHYGFIKTWHCGKKQSIVSLCITNSEETLAIALKSNDIGTCSLSQAIMYDSVKFNIFCGGFHSGKIQEMDLAVQRPLLATCSDVDHTLRIWNYNSMTCELAKKLYVVQSDAIDPSAISDIKPLLSVAFHPSGYYLAVSFIDKVRLFHLLFDELRFFREVNTPNSKVLKFSSGGHLLAIGTNQNINVYRSYTLQLVQVLQTDGISIQDIGWMSLDKKLVAVTSDGAIYEYLASTWGVEKEQNNSRVKYRSMAIANDTILANGVEGSQPIVMAKNSENGCKQLTMEKGLSQICYFTTAHRNSAYIASTFEGSLLIQGSTLTNTWTEELAAHQGSIVKLKASPDGKFVFSAGEDGSLFIFKVEESEILQPISEGKEKEITNKIVDDSLADIVLIEREKLEKFKAEVESERLELDRMNHTINQSTKIRESQYQAKLQEIRDSVLENIKAQQIRITELSAQKVRQERDYEKKLKQLEADHNLEVDNLENIYDRKLGIEDERYRQLEHDKVEMKQYYEEQMKNLRLHNENTIESLEKAFRDALCKAQEEYENTKRTSEELKDVYEKRLLQQEDEHEIEILDLGERFKKQLKELEEASKKLRSVNIDLLGEQAKANEEKNETKNETNKKALSINKKKEEIIELKKQIENLKMTIKEKEETLEKKEEKIYDYKHQIFDLETTKGKLHENKRDILNELQPKDEEIGTLTDRLKNVKADLLKEKKDNEELERNMSKMDELIKHLKTDNKTQEENTIKTDKIIRNIINDIHYSHTLDSKLKTDELKKLYQAYVINNGTVPRKDAESIEEIEHKLRYMEKSITGIHNTQLKSMKRFKVDLRKRTQENSTLIQELNKLRLEKKRDEFKIKQLEQELEQINNNFKSTVLTPKIAPPANKNKTQSATPYLNYLNKPSAIDNRLASLQDRQRIIELQNELEEKKEQNFYLRMEINDLKERIRQIGVF